MDKRTLRQQILQMRAALDPAGLTAASQALCRHLAAWPPIAQAHTVLAYLAFRNEISLQPLLDDHPQKRWALPRTLPRGVLSIHLYQPGRLVRHRYGMWEPTPNSPLVPLDEIEVVLVPGVAFDRQGGRLGFGGGYYDRLLPQLGAVRVGVTHPACLVYQVPRESCDCRVDYLALPDGVLGVAR